MALRGLPAHLSTKHSNIGKSYGYVPNNETVYEDSIPEGGLRTRKRLYRLPEEFTRITKKSNLFK